MADTDEAGDLDAEVKTRDQLAQRWCAEIAAAEKAQAKWVERGKKVERIYNDERELTSSRGRKFNILWSNVETLRPAVYMQTPKCKAVRRYRDRDPHARFASMLIERGVQTSCELYDLDSQIDQAVRDRLLPGRGQVWVFYAPEFVGEGDQQILAYENVFVEYVAWTDFLHSVTRTWTENRWVARRFHKTRKELRKWLEELGFDVGAAEKVSMDVSSDSAGADEGLKDDRAKAKIWEVWDKDSGQVIYVAPGSGTDAILGQKPPAVKYKDFWPCPRPLLATTTAKSLIPTPDYALYQDQAEELNALSARISALQRALKVVGVYAAESPELAEMIEASDNRMIAVKNWAMFAEGGGAKGRIEWFPIEQVAAVLKGLYEMRDQAKQTLYEVSGLGDILRGVTDPGETATAQGIKAKWGSQRIRRLQKDVQRFVADVMRLKAEVISEQFKFESILALGAVDEELLNKYVPPPPPQAPPQAPPQQPGMNGGQPPDPAMMQMQQQQQAMMAKQAHQQAVQQFLTEVEKLLRDDMARSFRIDVETDSTLEPDQAEEKQAAVEFMTAMTGFMKEAAPMAAAGPEAAKLVGELLLFGVRRFDKVEQLEQVIEQAVEAAAKPREPQPDPEMLKVQAEAERSKQELALKGQEMQAKGQELQVKAGEAQTKAQLENDKLKLEAQRMRIDAMIKAKELQIKQRELSLKEREVDDRQVLEREKLEDTKTARSEGFEAERVKAMSPEEREDYDAEKADKPTKAEVIADKMTEAMAALVAEMKRPKRLIRGADGRAEGVE